MKVEKPHQVMVAANLAQELAGRDRNFRGSEEISLQNHHYHDLHAVLLRFAMLRNPSCPQQILTLFSAKPLHLETMADLPSSPFLLLFQPAVSYDP